MFEQQKIKIKGKGNNPNSWKHTPFVKGHKYNIGKPCSEETKRKIGLANAISNKGQIAWNKGKTEIYSPETRYKMGSSFRGKHPKSEWKKGNISWNKGLIGFNSGEKNFNWKGGMPICKCGKKVSSRNYKLCSNCKSEHYIGNKNLQWKGGISYEPYSENWNKILKNLIRKRDNQICMNCKIHREKLNESLNVHHINYDKKLSIPENLICLCRKCHSLTTINRIYWTKLFQDKLSKLYGYNYGKEGIIEINIGEITI